MLAFYIDEALSPAEQQQVMEQLEYFGEKAGDHLEFRRIPYVFPADGSSVKNQEMIDVFKGHLRHAGVPTGRLSVFIMPKNAMRWAVLLQMAFVEVTGLYPYIVQPWTWEGDIEDSAIVRSEWMRVTNMNGAMAGL